MRHWTQFPAALFLEDIAEEGEEGKPATNKPVCADGKEGTFLQDDFTPDSFDTHLNAKLLLPDSGDNTVRARVVKRAEGEDGNFIGPQHLCWTLVPTLSSFQTVRLPNAKPM
jgi:hypothetical protein